MVIIDKQEIEDRLLFVLERELERIASEANSFHSGASYTISVSEHWAKSNVVRNASEGKYDRDYLNEKFGGHVESTHELTINLTLSYKQEELTVGPNKRW